VTSDHKDEMLIDLESGSFRAEIFSSREIYERELENVFSKCWLFLGHETQLPNELDFLNTYMAEDPVILVRQEDGTFRAFLNQCRHRGMQVNQYDFGNSPVFACPYHGWTYGADGALINVPMEDSAFPKCFDKGKLGLREVPRLEIYKGLIFGNWDGDAESLTDYLGEAAYYIDALFDRSPAGVEVIGGIHKWTIDSNWKLGAEQFASDMYHVALTHGGVVEAMTPEDVPVDRRGFAANPGKQYSALKGGHGSGFYLSDGDDAIIASILGPRVGEYYNTTLRDQATRRLDRVRGELMGSQHMTVFPNFSFLAGINTVRVWHPRGPDAMEVWSFVVVPKDAPQEVKDDYRRGVERTFSPAGTFEQDDAENWLIIQNTLKGYQASKSMLNLQMGLGMASGGDPTFPGTVGSCYSEEAARGFYAEWQRLINENQ